MRIFSKLVCVGVLGLASLGCSDGSDNGLSIAPDEAAVFAVANGCFAISPDGGQSFISRPDQCWRLKFGNALCRRWTPTPRPMPVGFCCGRPIWANTCSTMNAAILDVRRPEFAGPDIARLRYQRGQRRGGGARPPAIRGRMAVAGRVQWPVPAATHQDRAPISARTAPWWPRPMRPSCHSSSKPIVRSFRSYPLDATGEVTVTEFEDGSVFGFVETHAHLFTNLGFGGGGVFHGAPFHPLGVEHALGDCDAESR